MASASNKIDMRKQELLVKEITYDTEPLAALTAVTITASSGSLPTANGSLTIANAASPTVGELQEGIVELNAKLTTLIASLKSAGIMAE